MPGGYIRISPNPSIESLCDLTSRPGCGSQGRFHDELEQYGGLCISTIQPSSSRSTKSDERESNTGTHCPAMVGSTVVAAVNSPTDRFSNISGGRTKPLKEFVSTRGNTSSVSIPKIGR